MNSTPETVSKVNHSFVILIASIAAIGGFLFGFDTAVINGAVGAIQNTFDSSSAAIGFAVASALLGSAVGALLAGQFADRFGRTNAMVVASGLFFLSALGSGVAFGLWDLIVWRVVGGVAVGAASVIAPAYIAEVAPANIRGSLGSLQQLAIVIGIFVALVSDYFIASVAGSAESPFWFGIVAWRWMFWTEMIPALLYGIGAWLILPDSPRYLVAKGRESEATTILDKIGGVNAPAKVLEIRQTVMQERKPKFTDILTRQGGLLPIVWIGIGLSIFQQFVGINVIFYYSTVLWQSVGFSESDSLLRTVITGATNIVTTLIAIALVDKFGRKPLLLLGSIGMTLALGTMTYIFGNAPVNAAGNPNLGTTAGIIAFIAANVFVFFYGFSWGPVVWVMLGEMFNNRIRGAALSVSSSAQWIANFIISTTFPVLLAGFGPSSAYGLYTTAAAISLFFVLFFIRETKGIELEEM